ncbi:MAG TPA: DUF481 domain-containing protein [Verrucomicrobiae bacterium]|nr:DUF481 domain-containing protein [Verrucomicrobiae bacterium]
MTKYFFIALALVFFGFNSYAIRAVPTPAETNKPAWDSNVSLGFTLTSGNSDTLLATTGFKTHRNNLTNEWTISLDGSYGENSGEENNEQAHGVIQYNHLFTKRAYGYGRSDAFHDGIADVLYRFTTGPGAGYYFLKSKQTTLAAEAGPVGVIEKLDGERKNYVAARASERFEHKWDDHTRIWQDVEVLPQFDEESNFLLNAEVGAEAALTKTISLRVVLQDNYVNLPAPGRKANDIKVISGLVYKF